MDHLGKVSNVVKSDILPLTMIEWQCQARWILENGKGVAGQCSLFEHAVQANDIDLLKFLINLGAEQQELLAEEEDDQSCYTLNSGVFFSAIQHGRTAMLAEMIKVSTSSDKAVKPLTSYRPPEQAFPSTI